MNEFIEVMRQAGLNPPSNIKPGKWERFPGIGKNDTNTAAYYFLFPDEKGGIYGDFSSSLKEEWHSQEVRCYGPEELIKHKEMSKEAQKKRDEDQQIEYEKAAKKAQEIFNPLPEAKDHQYLKKKKVKSYGLKINGNLLVVPLYNNADIMTSYQTIAEDGEKRFFSGGKKKGSAFPIPGNTETVFICEGYATGASIHEVTGNMVLIAFDAGNILNIAEVAQKKGYQRIVVGADNDKAGIEAGKKVYEKHSEIKYIVPPNEGQDWNDYFQENGTEATKDKILSLIVNDWPEPLPLVGKIKSELYPLEALPDTVKKAVQEVLSFTKAPPSLVASSALSAVSLASQAHFDVERAEKLHGPMSLYLLTIADSGERKTTCDNFFTTAIKEYERKEAIKAKHELEKY